ncbi:hypothetical protein SAY86_011714 [Trapa natans]|uniref:Uncharacterized protein n=1 Tax=Trapa natans TaxID=22666 RepID=A0AAN7LZR8_TRANT|nr:hypothetical protein SAY86_011714 [Trapa natans]
MEPAKIDWKSLQWVFVEDELYEHINAPKWFDFSAPQEDSSADDVAWFCRPDCDHPVTADDFLKSTPKPSKKSANAYKTLLLGERNQRDFSIKRRGLHGAEDSENQNPNLSTPVNQHVRSLKAAVKSSSERKKPVDEPSRANEGPRLKSTLSARNLFAGGSILSQITDFVGELKRLASRAKEREENAEKLNSEKNRANLEEGTGQILKVKGDDTKERKPLLNVGVERSDGSEMSVSKEKTRMLRRVDETENLPLSLDMENVMPKRENILSQIRTSPPTPQCFSATRGTTKRTPAKETRTRFMETKILQEVKQNPEETEDGGERKMMDLFWLLKPCTPSG